MSELPWVRFFPSDWLAGTRGMSAAETGIYITLVATMYERREPVPEDHSRLARLCGAPVATFKKTLETLVEEGKIQRVDGGLWNKRVGEECEYRAEKSEAAANAAAARWSKKDKKNNDRDNATALQTQSGGNANQKPDTREPSSLRSEGSDAHQVRSRSPDPIIVLAGVVGNLDAKRFVDHLSEAGKRPSSQTAEAMSSILLAYKAKGGNPVEAVNYAIRRGWKSLDLEWLLRDVPPADASAPKPTPLAQWTTDQWRKTLEYCRERGEWEKVLGPPPWADGCLCPRDLWQDRDRQRFGVEVAA